MPQAIGTAATLVQTQPKKERVNQYDDGLERQKESESTGSQDTSRPILPTNRMDMREENTSRPILPAHNMDIGVKDISRPVFHIQITLHHVPRTDHSCTQW